MDGVRGVIWWLKGAMSTSRSLNLDKSFKFLSKMVDQASKTRSMCCW
jgi:hypothetical protein